MTKGIIEICKEVRNPLFKDLSPFKKSFSLLYQRNMFIASYTHTDQMVVFLIIIAMITLTGLISLAAGASLLWALVPIVVLYIFDTYVDISLNKEKEGLIKHFDKKGLEELSISLRDLPECLSKKDYPWFTDGAKESLSKFTNENALHLISGDDKRTLQGLNFVLDIEYASVSYWLNMAVNGHNQRVRESEQNNQTQQQQCYLNNL